MGFLSHIDSNIIVLGVGALMLLGSFATINSRSASKFDHDFALLLLIAGIVCLGIGFGFIDLSELKHLLPD
ncbi:hypothetical protein [Evansella clarkii]|uniref:hypothetical protein n=1 Tax=Evansella clarkii TaxID=79879 RepID=UPI000996441F|nr:hypothetical protein [Evansella clarkii]